MKLCLKNFYLKPYFDAYSYLYIPMGGNKMSKLRQIISLSSSFVFLTIWHGQSLDVLLWSFGNLVMVLSELFYFKVLAKHLLLTQLVRKLPSNYFNAR